MKRLLLAGAGNAHLEVLRRFTHRRPDAEVTLVTPDVRVLYSGMVPGLLAGQYGRADCEIDASELAASAGVGFRLTSIAAIDTQAKSAMCADGSTLSFDVMSINTGSAALPEAFRAIPSLHPLRPLSRFVDEFEDRIAGGVCPRMVIVGGGPAAVEIALAMRERMRERHADTAQVTMVTDTNAITPRLPAAVRARLSKFCFDAGIGIMTGTRICGATTESGLVAEDGRHIPADIAWWAGGAVASSWWRDSRLTVDADGFVLVDENLQSVSHPGIFAAGDTACLAGHGRRHSGVHAVRQGPVLAHNLMAALGDAALRRYIPQRVSLAILRTGPKDAIAAYGPLSAHGAWVWRWKDRIDRRYVGSMRRDTTD